MVVSVAQEAQEQSHSLTPPVVVAVVVVTVQTSAGLIIQDTLVVMVVVDLLTHIIVQLTEQVVVVEQELTDKDLTELAAVQITDMLTVQAAAADLEALADIPANLGQTVKVTAITAAGTTAAEVVVVEQAMAAGMAAKALSE